MAKVSATIKSAREYQKGVTSFQVELDDQGVKTLADVSVPTNTVSTKDATATWLAKWLGDRLSKDKADKAREDELKTVTVQKDKP
jgi:hypothetical protein